MDNGKEIVYIYGRDLINYCNKLPTMLNRASIVQDLINSYDLLSHKKVLVVKSQDATEEELKLFHSSSYIEFLKKVNDNTDHEICEEEQLEFGLTYDCPILENNYDFIKSVAGSSLTAAKLLLTGNFKTAINWFGGWHHAQRDSAEGFCYVNDIVIAIQKLKEKFEKILYLDIDIHHGNGVQNAFELSNKIMTLSFHKLMPGFYPGTGNIEEIGSVRGKYHSINIPLLQGVSDETFLDLFHKVFPRVFDSFNPNVIVMQCGADGLNGDEVGECNLTIDTYKECLKSILNLNIPLLLLGGGGYNFANTARLWSSLTATVLNQEIDNDIPDNCVYFPLYEPTYELHIEAGRRKDYNTKEYINNIITTVESYCENIKS